MAHEDQKMIHGRSLSGQVNEKLEQLERLHSEIPPSPPLPHDYPY